MCVICQFKPGFMPSYDKFQNAVFNNPHGFGLLLKGGGKIECIKECPEGGNDPEKIYKLLEDNKDIERILHLRWRTEGPIDLDNTQPFLAYKSGKREIWFAHNGTLDQYKPKVHTYNGTYHKFWSDELEEKFKEASDTRRFLEFRLKGLLPRLINPEGKRIDLDDPIVGEILSKFWPLTSGNRGILVSNDQDPYYFNFSDWKTIKTPEGEFMASNDTYFDRLMRGYEFDKREAERKAKEAEKKKTSAPVHLASHETLLNFNSGGSNIFGHPLFNSKFRLGTDVLANLFQDWDLYSPEWYHALANLSVDEMKEIVNKTPEEDLVALIGGLTNALKQTGEENIKLGDKLQKASKLIESLKFGAANDIQDGAAGFTLVDSEGNPLSEKIAKIDKKTRVVTIINPGAEEQEAKIG